MTLAELQKFLDTHEPTAETYREALALANMEDKISVVSENHEEFLVCRNTDSPPLIKLLNSVASSMPEVRTYGIKKTMMRNFLIAAFSENIGVSAPTIDAIPNEVAPTTPALTAETLSPCQMPRETYSKPKKEPKPSPIVSHTSIPENRLATKEAKAKKFKNKTAEIYSLLIQEQQEDYCLYRKKSDPVIQADIDYLQTATNFKLALSNISQLNDEAPAKYITLYRSKKNGIAQPVGQVSFNGHIPKDLWDELASIRPDGLTENKLLIDINNDPQTTKKIAETIAIYISTLRDKEPMNKTLKSLNGRVI